MLYDRWREIARLHRDQIALVEVSSAQRWTFHQLDLATEKAIQDAPALATPQGICPEFIFTVLRAWRNGTVVCPLEHGQQAPQLNSLPKGCVHLKTTSASTGTSRVIAFTGAQLAADSENIVQTMELTPAAPNLGVISLAHSYGFSNLVLPLVLHGIPLILAGAPLPEIVRRAALAWPQVTLAAVPALWRAWHQAGAIPENVAIAISAGAPLPLALEHEVYDRSGLKLHNFYGASECGGIAYDRAAKPRKDARCAGAPMDNVAVTIDRTGVLRVQSGAVGLTYWPEPSSNLSDGSFITTDLVSFEEGLIYLHGRQTDQINVAGRKVSPETIECALTALSEVRDCLVFGVPSGDQDRTETIVACVVCSGDTGADVLKQHLLGILPAWQVPRAWWFVDTLQANARGKLSRSEWRRRFLEERGGCEA